jgi:hypothetical protein
LVKDAQEPVRKLPRGVAFFRDTNVGAIHGSNSKGNRGVNVSTVVEMNAENRDATTTAAAPDPDNRAIMVLRGHSAVEVLKPVQEQGREQSCEHRSAGCGWQPSPQPLATQEKGEPSRFVT